MASSRWRRTGGACTWGRRVAFWRERTIILLLIGCSCFSLPAQGAPRKPDPSNLRSPPQEQSPVGQCTAASGVTSCSCRAVTGGATGTGRAAPEELPATLSEDSPKLDLTCTGSQNTAVPETMADGDVCPKEAEMSLCSKSYSTAPNTAVKLNSLLGTTTAVNWTQSANTGAEKKYALDVPEDAFPLVDKDFSVGCKANGTAVCKLSVAVKARKSTTVGQVVTCAYGLASNDTRQSVTLTPSKNRVEYVLQ